MPYLHVPIFPSQDDKYISIRAVVYRSTGAFPRQVKVIAHDSGTRRFVFVEGILRGRFQPRIHGGEVTVVDMEGTEHTFYFFFKNHRRLPINQTIFNLAQGKNWHGDAAVFRVGSNGNRLVNLRPGDRPLADYALKKCCQTIKQGRRVKIPKKMHFSMLDD